MALLRTSYLYRGFLEYYFSLDYNLVRFGVCKIKLRHQRMLILRYILPPKTELPPEKKLPPPPRQQLKNLEHPDKKLKSLGIS